MPFASAKLTQQQLHDEAVSYALQATFRAQSNTKPSSVAVAS